MAYALVNTNSSGDTTVFDPGANGRVRVTGWHLVAAGAVTVQFKFGSTATGGAMTLATGVPNTLMPGNSLDHDQILCGANSEALKLTLGGAVQVSGVIRYDRLPN